jgi:hypothetical protein
VWGGRSPRGRAQAVAMIVGNGCMTGQTMQLGGGLSFT